MRTERARRKKKTAPGYQVKNRCGSFFSARMLTCKHQNCLQHSDTYRLKISAKASHENMSLNAEKEAVSSQNFYNINAFIFAVSLGGDKA